jgi:hypothetical protein
MKIIYSNLINSIETKIKDRKDRKALPDNCSIEDIFGVSFPKSGNTWLRFLVEQKTKTIASKLGYKF